MSSLAVIEIDSEIMKIVHAQDDAGSIFINKIITRPVTGLAPEEVSLLLSRTLSQNSIKADKIIALISRKDLTVRMLKLPSANKEELQQMASFEAIKQIPFAPEDTLYDHRTMELTEDGYSYVIMSIAHKNVVNNFIEILNKALLKSDTLTLTTEGLFLWVKLNFAEAVKNQNTILAMDIDRNKIELLIVSGERILLSRTSSFGALSLAEANTEHPAYRERLLLEINRSIDIYNKESKQNLTLNKIIVTGCTETVGALTDILKGNFEADVHAVESTSSFKLSDKALLKENLPKDISVTSALGATLALQGNTLNMLPPEIKKKQAFIEKWKKMVILAALGVCIFSTLSAATALRFYQKAAALKNIKISIKKISPVTKKLEAKFKRLELMQSHMDASKKPLVFLYELHRVIPQNVLLNYLSFDRKGIIILQGTTSAMSDVFNFVNKLEKSSKFKDVETNYVSKRQLKDRETVDFQITCRLSSGGSE